MPPTYSHPGVYVEELPGPAPITGVSTSIAAFLGLTEIGPYDKATLITSWSDFSRTFGQFSWDSHLPMAVYQFFQQGGSQCYVTRLSSTHPTDGRPPAVTLGLANNAIQITFQPLWRDPWLSSVLTLTMIPYPEPEDVATGSLTGPCVLALLYTPEDGQPVPEKPVTSGRNPSQVALEDYIRTNELPLVDRDIIGEDGTVRTPNLYVLELWPPFHFFPKEDTIEKIQDSILSQLQSSISLHSLFLRADEVTVNSIPDPSSETRPAINLAFPHADIPESITWNFSQPAEEGKPALGIHTFDTIPDVSILATPDLSTLETRETNRTALLQEILNYCEHRRDLFYIIDSPRFGPSAYMDTPDPQPPTAQGMLNFKNPLNSSYGALYYPWVKVLGPMTNEVILTPPSGAIAGIYANTDTAVGVWAAPAGIANGALRSVVELQLLINDADQNILNPNGINALRHFPGSGNVVWGARTLSASMDWIYISVRRLAIYIEESLKQSLTGYAFEPNTATTWTTIKREFAAFLTNLWQMAGLIGSTASEAFFVTVDETNNPPSQRQTGVLRVDVGYAPVKPAEFIVIGLEQEVLTN